MTSATNRYPDFRLQSSLPPSRSVFISKVDQWHWEFVACHSGATAPEFHGVPRRLVAVRAATMCRISKNREQFRTKRADVNPGLPGKTPRHIEQVCDPNNEAWDGCEEYRTSQPRAVTSQRSGERRRSFGQDEYEFWPPSSAIRALRGKKKMRVFPCVSVILRCVSCVFRVFFVCAACVSVCLVAIMSNVECRLSIFECTGENTNEHESTRSMGRQCGNPCVLRT